jgi:hypothetical protein
MKLTRTLTIAIVASIGPVAAATLPLDRPTPPPCCADGICAAHASSFGYFPTRWRVWPGLSQAPLPTVKQPTIRQIPGITPIEPPSPEEEDRQAPQPIRTLAPPRPTTEAPPTTTSPTTTPPPSTPQTRPFDGPTGPAGGAGAQTPPSTLVPRSSMPTGTTPGLPQPGQSQPSPLFDGQPPGGGATSPSSLFPPSASLNGAQPAGSANAYGGTIRPASAATAAPARQRRNSDDPPPPPPFTLGNSAR